MIQTYSSTGWSTYHSEREINYLSGRLLQQIGNQWQCNIRTFTAPDELSMGFSHVIAYSFSAGEQEIILIAGLPYLLEVINLLIPSVNCQAGNYLVEFQTRGDEGP